MRVVHAVAECQCGRDDRQRLAAGPQAAINQRLLKNWTRDLELTDAQQKSLQGLLDKQRERILELEKDESLTPVQAAVKKTEFRTETYSKIKPLLTAEQLPVFEKLIAPPSKAKKA